MAQDPTTTTPPTASKKGSADTPKESSASPVQKTAEAATKYTVTLNAENESCLHSKQYFNVFPPYLKTPAQKEQILLAQVSEATKPGGKTTLTWNAGSGAIKMFAILRDGKPEKAAEEGTTIALGDVVTVSYQDDKFLLTPASGGTEGVITVKPGEDIPLGSYIGVQTGPAPILLVIPADGSSLTLTPNLTLAARIIFGSAYSWPKPTSYDESKPLDILITPETADTASASIIVGPDNKLSRTDLPEPSKES